MSSPAPGVGALMLTVAAALAPAAPATLASPAELPDPTREQLSRSVHQWTRSALDAAVHQWTPGHLQDSVRTLEQTREEEGATVIELATDILFEVNAWDIPGPAAERITELIAEIPEGAAVTITGHTDSTPTGEDFDNAELSQKRARAVADVVSTARPDLELEVSGAGDSDPAVTEDPEDPSTLAANRRVEITYSGD